MNIGSRRELFWDDYLIDAEKTTAERRIGTPVRKGVVMTYDEPWEGDGCDFQNIICDHGVYKMYYLGYRMVDRQGKSCFKDIYVCYAESRDCLSWAKPKLGIVEFEGSRENNIICSREMLGISMLDNFFVTLDENPDRRVPERYKAVAANWISREVMELTSFVSDDGIHWRRLGAVTTEGYFDSLNTVHWNTELKKYLCFMRGLHKPDGSNVTGPWDNEAIRDVRVLESEDFITWTKPKLLDFGANEDYPLYTNVVTQYYRAPHVMTGFPTRYVERRQWTKNFHRLCGEELRKAKCADNPRFGLTITDCVFMCSRDGYKWTRYDDAFFRPLPENGLNWLYGDCYPTVGMFETKSDIDGADNEISMFVHENHWTGYDVQLARYAIRKDGFVSMHAGIKPEKIVTKEFTFEGSTMLLNFATSARGCLYVTLRSTESGKELHSGEIFGNRTDRVIDFDGEISEFSGKGVVMEIEICDADVYAFKFE